MDKIELDYRNAKKLATELDGLASKLRRQSCTELDTTLRQVLGAWTSDHTASFVAKGETLKNRIKASANDLEDTADRIRRIAKRVYDSEQKAKALAEARKYGK